MSIFIKYFFTYTTAPVAPAVTSLSIFVVVVMLLVFMLRFCVISKTPPPPPSPLKAVYVDDLPFFSIDKKYCINGISIGFDNKEKCIVWKHIFAPCFKKILYSDIVGVELLENEVVVKKGGVGRAIVGGLLFGGVGAIVGATNVKKQDCCRQYKNANTNILYKDPSGRFYVDGKHRWQL